MQLALTLNPFVDTDLIYAQQLGVDWIVADVPAWDRETLAAACNRVEQAGLHLSGLTCLPPSLLASALSDRPEGEAALDQLCQMISDAGALGIPLLGYQWLPADAGHVPDAATGRGGALSTVYRVQERGRVARRDGRDALWRRLSDILQRVVPVAEAAGVRLAYRADLAVALLPEDERILDSVDELDRLFRVASSPWHGLDLDHGYVTQVLGPGDEAIRHFGEDSRIFAARLRNVRATERGAEETFPDEDRVAMLRAVQMYAAAGYDGPLCPVPSPAMTDDTAWRHKGVAFSVGYLRALLQATSGVGNDAG